MKQILNKCIFLFQILAQSKIYFKWLFRCFYFNILNGKILKSVNETNHFKNCFSFRLQNCNMPLFGVFSILYLKKLSRKKDVFVINRRISHWRACKHHKWYQILTYIGNILNSKTVWNVSKYGVFSGSFFPVFELNTEIYSVNLRLQSNTRKYGPEKTPYLDTFDTV